MTSNPVQSGKCLVESVGNGEPMERCANYPACICGGPQEEMDDSEMWREHDAQSKQRRAGNRDNSSKLLQDAGVLFESKNGGAHLIVEGRWDFWPGTGLWIDRTTKKRQRGVHNLLKAMRQDPVLGGRLK